MTDHEALTAAYMEACKGRPADHNEIGLWYFRKGWEAAMQQETGQLSPVDWQVISSALSTSNGVAAAEAQETKDIVMRAFWGKRSAQAQRVYLKVADLRARSARADTP